MQKKHQSGITLIEIIIVMGIFAILFGFTTINLLGANQKTSTTALINTLISDIRHLQIRAMAGEINSLGNSTSLGIRFETDKYILFQGNTYVSTNSSNYAISLDENLVFSPISLPQQQVIFASGSGEIINYSSTSHSVTITNTVTNAQKTIQFNKYGVITQIQ